MIKEMNRLMMLEEKSGVKVPMPNFFYVERYGRKVEEQMDSILSGIGKKEWFLFKTDCRFKEGGILHNFVMELEKYAKLGKEYDECVLVELAEDIHMEDEFEEFLGYLKTLENKIYFLFTMKQAKNTAIIQQCIEQYFFVRTIYAGEYSGEEQWEVIQSTCKEYHFTINCASEAFMRKRLEKKVWNTEEQVVCKLKNGVRSMVYEGMLDTDISKKETSVEAVKEDKWIFTLEMAEKMFAKMEPESKKKAIIGFNQGGLQYE